MAAKSLKIKDLAGKYGLSLLLDRNAARSLLTFFFLLSYISTVLAIDALPVIVSALNSKSLMNP